MVVRRRRAKILVPLVLYTVSAALAGYFVHHAHSGPRGIEAKRQFKLQAHDLRTELAELRQERTEWERRIGLLRSDQIDRDLLEERARVMLGRVHRNDLVIVTGP